MMRAMKLRGGLRRSPEMRTIGLVWPPLTSGRTVTEHGVHAGGARRAAKMRKDGAYDR